MDDVIEVRHGLCRMVDVALQVDERRALFKHTMMEAFIDGIHESLHVFMAFADKHVIADTDDIRHEGYHVRGLADGLTMGDLGFLLIQVIDGQTEQIAGGSERAGFSL